MKVYSLQILENIVGIGLAISFVYGFFQNIDSYLIAGGVGTILYMTSQLQGQPSNAGSFLFMLILGSIVASFFSKWYYGLFWVSTVFAFGQIFGLIKLLTSRNEMIQMLEMNDANQISLRDSVSFLLIVAVPAIIFYYLQ